MAAAEDYFRYMKQEIPGLIIETGTLYVTGEDGSAAVLLLEKRQEKAFIIRYNVPY